MNPVTSDLEMAAPIGLTPLQQAAKRSFDLVLAMIGLLLTWWIILLAYVAASIDTGQNGFFAQVRIGQYGRPFKVLKIRTMRDDLSRTTTVTRTDDPRITPLGRFLRKTKIDELPQLINVLLGQMSFVGPRPDVPGFADQLAGDDQVILTLRPGITGPATLAFRNEEELLAEQADPETYNLQVIYPEKVRLNRQYIENYRFMSDLRYIYLTILSSP